MASTAKPVAPPVSPAPALKAPLGLPTGSVRAILALVLCGTQWYLILQGRAVPELLASAALLVVAFYFGVRSTAPVTGPAPAAKVRQPLFLPRGSVRFVLLGGFLAVIAYVWVLGRAVPQELALIFQVLLSYLIGFAFAALVYRRAQKGLAPSRTASAARSGIAVVALAVTGVVCSSIASGVPAFVPEDAEKFLTWTVAFYFGSRLSP